MTQKQRLPKQSKYSPSLRSQRSYDSEATTLVSTGSNLLFGEIPSTSATEADETSIHLEGSVCSHILSPSSTVSRLWLSEPFRDALLRCMDPESLSSFRLVCRAFSEEAAARLFERIAVTFKPSTFRKPARVEALSRIGVHVKTFTFRMPSGSDFSLPPVIDRRTGEEKPFVYEPRVSTPQKGLSNKRRLRYGSEEMQDLLVDQYPPLFHAATDVDAFHTAFSYLTNLTHFVVSIPQLEYTLGQNRSIIDYAMMSLRIAIESASLPNLNSLSLDSIPLSSLNFLHPVLPSAQRWAQIRHLSISTAYTDDALDILHSHLAAFSSSLTCLHFRWEGDPGPCLLTSHNHFSMLSAASDNGKATYPRGNRACNPPIPTLACIQTLTLENMFPEFTPIIHVFQRHQKLLQNIEFNHTSLDRSKLEAVLEVSAAVMSLIEGERAQTEAQAKFMEVPVMLDKSHGRPAAAETIHDAVIPAFHATSGGKTHVHQKGGRRRAQTLPTQAVPHTTGKNDSSWKLKKGILGLFKRGKGS